MRCSLICVDKKTRKNNAAILIKPTTSPFVLASCSAFPRCLPEIVITVAAGTWGVGVAGEDVVSPAVAATVASGFFFRFVAGFRADFPPSRSLRGEGYVLRFLLFMLLKKLRESMSQF